MVWIARRKKKFSVELGGRHDHGMVSGIGWVCGVGVDGSFQ